MANFVKKENAALKIAKYLIPWKGDSTVEIIRKIIFLAAAAVLIVSVTLLILQGSQTAADNKTNGIISDIYHGTSEGGANNVTLTGNTTLNIDTSKQEQIREENPEILEEFVPLLAINDDVVGWLSLGDPDRPFIDYPVVQCKNNDYYVNHNINGAKSDSGALFADYRIPTGPNDDPANLIVYGHNVASGEYFGMLPRYYNYLPAQRGDLTYHTSYPTFTYSSLYEKHTYKIFAGIMVNTEEEAGDVFYYLRGRKFENKAAFDDYIAQILDRSTFYTDVDLKYGDRIMTLSTCIMSYGVDARFVLFGRRVREGEDPSVDVSKTRENPDPLFFDYYYDRFTDKSGWGGRKWPAEMIYGYSY